jgi:hypothetical protein
MNLIHAHLDVGKSATALFYPLSLIKVNLVRLFTLSHDGQMTNIYTVTEKVTVFFALEGLDSNFSSYFTKSKRPARKFLMKASLIVGTIKLVGSRRLFTTQLYLEIKLENWQVYNDCR